MNKEEKTGRTIASLLDHSLHDITPGTLYQLRAARRAALESYQPAEKMLHAGAGISARNGHHWLANHAGKLLLSASFLLLLIIHSFWQVNYRIEDKSAASHAIFTNNAPAESFSTEDTTNFEEDTDDGTSDETAPHDTENNDNSENTTDVSETDVNEEADSDAITDSVDSSEAQDPDWMDESSDSKDDRNSETDVVPDETSDVQDFEEAGDTHDAESPDTDSEDRDMQDTEIDSEISAP